MAHPIWSLFYGIMGMAGGSCSDFEKGLKKNTVYISMNICYVKYVQFNKVSY
jgi:hypothetical protein